MTGKVTMESSTNITDLLASKEIVFCTYRELGLLVFDGKTLILISVLPPLNSSEVPVYTRTTVSVRDVLTPAGGFPEPKSAGGVGCVRTVPVREWPVRRHSQPPVRVHRRAPQGLLELPVAAQLHQPGQLSKVVQCGVSQYS